MEEVLKLLNVKLITAQIVCFFLVLWLLRKFLWKPVFQILEERKKKIEAELKTIDDAKADVAKLKNEYQQFLDKIEDAAQKRIKEAELAGESSAHDIRDRARQEAERIVEDARREIRFEIAKSREELKADVVNMVIKVSEQMIQEKLSFEDDRKIVENFLADLEKSK